MEAQENRTTLSARMPETIKLQVHKSEYSSHTNMLPALSASDAQELRRLIPLNTLPDNRFEQLCSQIRIEETPRGSVLFRQGETKTEFVYLLSGTISLRAGGVEMDLICGGTDTARFALAHQIPRKVSAVAKDTVRYVRINPEIISQPEELNRGLSTYKVSDIPEETTRDWMTALLKSPIFQRLSPANIQAILRSLEEIEVKAGDVICRQGDPGDFYYIIKKGRCALTRKPSRLAKEIKLATLRTSDTFGEDSLISGDPRNVTVTMLTDGVLLRLDKANFIKLLKAPVISHVDMETAQRMASRDAVWLDVRSPDSYEQGHLPGSLNIPFFSLRVMLPTLNRQSEYLLVCEDGRLSEAAAFLLMRYSFEAHVLTGGIGSMPRDYLVVEIPKSVPSSSLATTAYSKPKMVMPNLTTAPIAGDVIEDLGQQEELSSDPDDVDDDKAGQTEDPEKTRNAFNAPALENSTFQESESTIPCSPTDHASTLNTLIPAEREENQSGTEPMQPVVLKNGNPEAQLTALKHRLLELEATIQEGLSRERDLAQRLAASETAAAEATSKAHALKTELEQVRELANDRETALRSLQENYEHLLTEQTKNIGAENNPGGVIEHGATADKTALRNELDAARRQHADELMGMQTRLRDMEEERNQLREALQSARTRLAVMETAESAARTADENPRKKRRFEFAVTLPVTVAITLFLTALALGGLFGTASGRKFLSRLLTQPSQVSVEHSPPNPILSTPTPGS